MEERKIKTVTLTLTQACNLSCTYCYEHHKSNRRMSVETAKSIVDYELKNFADFEGIEFDLFGGEPFLAFDLVREITDYICSKKGDIPCTVFATTNGTLVHGEVQDWLREHVGCFICGLALTERGICTMSIVQILTTILILTFSLKCTLNRM